MCLVPTTKTVLKREMRLIFWQKCEIGSIEGFTEETKLIEQAPRPKMFRILIPFTTMIAFDPVTSVITISVLRVIYVGGPSSVRYPTNAMIHI
jgi:hypothetical protein